MNYQDTAQQIIPLIGGKDNVQSLFHCITRLRFLLRDNSKADRHALEALDGVIGVNISGDQFQLIIGNDVKPLCDALLSQLPLQEASVRPASRCNPVSAVLEGLSGIFSPIIPAIAGAGILKGILALMVAFHWLETQTRATRSCWRSVMACSIFAAGAGVQCGKTLWCQSLCRCCAGGITLSPCPANPLYRR